MKNAVKDLVLRMTGGNEAVAEICAATVADVEDGDVCRRVSEEEAKALAAEPSVGVQAAELFAQRDEFQAEAFRVEPAEFLDVSVRQVVGEDMYAIVVVFGRVFLYGVKGCGEIRCIGIVHGKENRNKIFHNINGFSAAKLACFVRPGKNLS